MLKSSTSLPYNEFRFLSEILSNPISDPRFEELRRSGKIEFERSKYYEISREAPRNAFGDLTSKKTLAQAAKKRLEERELIRVIDPGSPSKRTVVYVGPSREEIQSLQSGPRSSVKRGRPPKDKSPFPTRSSATSNSESVSLQSLRERLMPDLELFLDAVAVIKRYPEFMARAGITISEGED